MRLLLSRIESGRLLLDAKDCQDLIRWRDHQLRKLTPANVARRLLSEIRADDA